MVAMRSAGGQQEVSRRSPGGQQGSAGGQQEVSKKSAVTLIVPKNAIPVHDAGMGTTNGCCSGPLLPRICRVGFLNFDIDSVIVLS